VTKVGGGVPAVRTRVVQDFRNLSFRFLVAIDVEGFSQRHTAEQAKAQDDLEQAMRQAAADAGLNLERWYRQPRGDGELAVLPEGTDGLALVADYPRKLASAVAEVNQSGKDGPRLRARIAIHHGAVAPGRFGPVGAAPVEVSRLVDAEIVRQQLRQRDDLDIALIVSATVYHEVVQSRLHDLHPEVFRRAVVRSKGITYTGYLCQEVMILRENDARRPKSDSMNA
jgi:class 3 adenylate cyclase